MESIQNQEKKWIQLEKYSIYETNGKGLLLTMPFVSSEPKNPFIVYDGKDHALLFFNKKLGFILDYINPLVSKKLHNSKFIHILEWDGNAKSKNERLSKVTLKKSQPLKIVLSKKGMNYDR